MAISTYGITLKSGATAGSLTKLVDIKEFPDIGGAPEGIDVTTLSDSARVYILGIQSQEVMEFTANYTKTDYNAVKARVATDFFFALEFGTAGDEGIFTWEGTFDVYLTGNGVNAPVEMVIVVAPSTKPVITS